MKRHLGEQAFSVRRAHNPQVGKSKRHPRAAENPAYKQEEKIKKIHIKIGNEHFTERKSRRVKVE